LARWRFLGWKVCFVIVPARNPLHPASGFPSIDPRRHVNAPIAQCTGGARSSSGG
jgi:hypothetical protein